MAAPVIYTPSVGDPYPLLRDAGGGALVPAVADDPCGCCGGFVDCFQCQGFEASENVLVTIAGITNGETPPAGACDEIHNCEGINGSYLLEFKTFAEQICGVLGCTWELSFPPVWYCTPTAPGNDYGLCHARLNLYNGFLSFILFRDFGSQESPDCTGCQAWEQWGLSPGAPVDCIDGVYELNLSNPNFEGPGNFERCYINASTCTVQFGG